MKDETFNTVLSVLITLAAIIALGFIGFTFFDWKATIGLILATGVGLSTRSILRFVNK